MVVVLRTLSLADKPVETGLSARGTVLSAIPPGVEDARCNQMNVMGCYLAISIFLAR